MSELSFYSMDNLFTDKDFDDFKLCTQINFSNLLFKEKDIVIVSSKSEIKKILTNLFRAGNCNLKTSSSKDNWYIYFAGKNHVQSVCLYDDTERNNALLKTMQHIKYDTGFNLPYILLRFDLELDVIGKAPTHFDYNDGCSVDFCFDAFMLSEKYMHFLGMKAFYFVNHAMEKLNMPSYKEPTLYALITDESSDYWSFYVFISSNRFDISNWSPPDEYCLCT